MVIQAKHPEIVKEVVSSLQYFRDTGIPVSRILAQSILIGTIQAKAPQLLDGKFKCSDNFVERFLHTYANFSPRVATHAAQKLPDDWDKQCEDAFLRIVEYVRRYNIPPELIVNADQTGLCVIPAGNKTWDKTGSKQVSTFGKDEKQQFTMLVGLAASGDVIPFQCIHKGKTSASLPSEAVRAEGERIGITWVPGGKNHWSSVETMKLVCNTTTWLTFGITTNMPTVGQSKLASVHRGCDQNKEASTRPALPPYNRLF